MLDITFLFKFHCLQFCYVTVFLVYVFLAANVNSFNVRDTKLFQYLSVIWLYN